MLFEGLLRDWTLLVFIAVPVGLLLIYIVIRLVSFGVFKSLFAARRQHYRKLKGDMEKWPKDKRDK